MKKTLILLLIMNFFLVRSALSTQSHCTGVNEFTYFSCKIKDSQKTVSICGNKPYYADVSSDDLILQFRSGVTGKPDIIYPYKAQSASEKIFEGDHLYLKEANRGLDIYNYSVYFKYKKSAYIVTMSFGEDEKKRSYISISHSGKSYLDFSCDRESSTKEVEVFSWLTNNLENWQK